MMEQDPRIVVVIARQLPPRQRQVLVLLGRGLMVKETAEKLKISESTVRNTRKTVYQKLAVHSAAQAARVAVLANLL